MVVELQVRQSKIPPESTAAKPGPYSGSGGSPESSGGRFSQSGLDGGKFGTAGWTHPGRAASPAHQKHHGHETACPDPGGSSDQRGRDPVRVGRSFARRAACPQAVCRGDQTCPPEWRPRRPEQNAFLGFPASEIGRLPCMDFVPNGAGLTRMALGQARYRGATGQGRLSAAVRRGAVQFALRGRMSHADRLPPDRSENDPCHATIPRNQ